MHLVVTDSGLGGLSVCGELERLLAARPVPGGVRVAYVNAWPDEGVGYNDLPDTAARTEVFDRALAAIEAMAPDWIAIACNTLSILYEHTAHARAADRPLSAQKVERDRVSGSSAGTRRRRAPVVGIIDTGVALFRRALADDVDASIVLLGTKTTIDSGVHYRRLIEAGIDAGKVAAMPCHGLAGAIETDPAGERVRELIQRCSAGAARAARPGGRLYLGLCCTHYTYVRERLEQAAGRYSQRPALALDPNATMAQALYRELKPGPAPENAGPRAAAEGSRAALASIRVISKVNLDAKRRGIADLLGGSAPLTAAALLHYTHEPDLF
jgi:glutamate racemase